MIHVDRAPGVRLVTDYGEKTAESVDEWYAEHQRLERIYDACRAETDSTVAWLVCVEARS